MTAAVEFQDVDILFAQQQGRDGRKAIREALAALDAGGTRTDIQSKFGVIVGVALPVVTMMCTGGHRSLTKAASFRPSMEPGMLMSVKTR